jgi:hypothetical protein
MPVVVLQFLEVGLAVRTDPTRPGEGVAGIESGGEHGRRVTPVGIFAIPAAGAIKSFPTHTQQEYWRSFRCWRQASKSHRDGGADERLTMRGKVGTSIG